MSIIIKKIALERLPEYRAWDVNTIYEADGKQHEFYRARVSDLDGLKPLIEFQREEIARTSAISHPDTICSIHLNADSAMNEPVIC